MDFGPLGDAIAVGSVIDKLADISKGQSFVLDDRSNPHEAQSLMLIVQRHVNTLIGDRNFLSRGPFSYI